MAVYNTESNGRVAYTAATLRSLAETVDWSRHRLFVVDNNECAASKNLYRVARNWLPFELIQNDENLGTARAVNKGWVNRKPDEACLKLDDDIEVETKGWLDVLEECASLDTSIGIIGLKRRDLMEVPYAPDGSWWKSELKMIEHEKGKRWLVIEYAQHVIGSCVLFAPRLLDKIGYLYQSGVYSWDDPLAAVRCHVAGLRSAFLPGVFISHIDCGGDAFTDWKSKYAGEKMADFNRIRAEYYAGTRSIYQGPDDE